MALTDLKIRKAKPHPKPYKRGDGGGLFLLVKPNGGKLWQQKYRFLAKEKLLSHGTYPVTCPPKSPRMQVSSVQVLVHDGPFSIFAWRQATQARMRAVLVVVVAPCPDHKAGMAQRVKQVLVAALVTHAS